LAREQSGGTEKVTDNLSELLRDSLNSQLSIYKQIHDLQNDLLLGLDSNNELGKIMDLLEKKNSLLDNVKMEKNRSAPLVDEWVERKNEMQNSPLFADIERILSEIVALILEFRSQDEAMLQRFDQQSQSKNRIDAFRSLR
jgi:predicted Mrr-cat superfamily restriction endonuclease